MNRAQRRAAARNHPTPPPKESRPLTDPATLALIGRLSECPDCCADTELVQPSPGVHLLEVRHDDTCPTYPRHARAPPCLTTTRRSCSTARVVTPYRDSGAPGRHGLFATVTSPGRDRYIRATRRAMIREERGSMTAKTAARTPAGARLWTRHSGRCTHITIDRWPIDDADTDQIRWAECVTDTAIRASFAIGRRKDVYSGIGRDHWTLLCPRSHEADVLTALFGIERHDTSAAPEYVTTTKPTPEWTSTCLPPEPTR